PRAGGDGRARRRAAAARDRRLPRPRQARVRIGFARSGAERGAERAYGGAEPRSGGSALLALRRASRGTAPATHALTMRKERCGVRRESGGAVSRVISSAQRFSSRGSKRWWLVEK